MAVFTPLAGASAPTAPSTAKPKDIVGRAKERLLAEPPAGSRSAFGESELPGRAMRAFADVMGPESIPEAIRDLVLMATGGGLGSAAARAGIPAAARLWPAVREGVAPLGRRIAERAGRALAPGVAQGGTAALTGDDVLSNTASGLTAGTMGELGSMLRGALQRRHGYEVSEHDVRQIADAVARIIPDAKYLLRNVKTVGQLQDVLLGRARQTDPPAGIRDALSLGHEMRIDDVVKAFNQLASQQGYVPLQTTATTLEHTIDVPALGLTDVPVKEALGRLSQLFKGAWTPEGIPIGSMTSAARAQKYMEARQQIVDMLSRVSGPGQPLRTGPTLAAPAFEQAQQQYRQGVRIENLADAVDPTKTFAGRQLGTDELLKAYVERLGEMGRDIPAHLKARLERALGRGRESSFRDAERNIFKRGGENEPSPGLSMSFGQRPIHQHFWQHFRVAEPRFGGAVPRKSSLGLGYPAPLSWSVPTGQAVNRILEEFRQQTGQAE